MAHKRARKRLGVLVLASVLQLPALAAEAPAVDMIPTSLAKEVVRRTIELVEANALPPRDPAEYAQAKTALLATLGAAGEQTDRRMLFQHVDALLGTLDADRHSFIQSPIAMRQQQAAIKTASSAGAPPSSFSIIQTRWGKVLHWTPPQSIGNVDTEAPGYLRRFAEDAAALPGSTTACALVVDLSAQRGGNVWPPLVAMHPLFSADNSASFVNRSGARHRYVSREYLAGREHHYAGALRNPFARFAGTPLAVVVDRQTSSAGEMLLLALMGEGARTRTFGTASHGMTTVNMSYQMADGSLLALSEQRYALGEAPFIRGGIPVQVQAPPEPAVRQAAEWAASRSPLCRTPRQASAAP